MELIYLFVLFFTDTEGFTGNSRMESAHEGEALVLTCNDIGEWGVRSRYGVLFCLTLGLVTDLLDRVCGALVSQYICVYFYLLNVYIYYLCLRRN